MDRRTIGRYAAAVPALLAGTAAVVAGAGLLAGSGSPADAGAVPAVTQAAEPVPPARTAPPRSRPAARPATPPATPPVRVVVPGLVDAPVVPVAAGLDGRLSVPEQVNRVGWWALGAVPGSTAGTVLLAGHVDSATAGLGAFAALWDVPLGAGVTVTGSDGTAHPYRITARRVYRRTALPADLFTGAGAPRLALVTCTGGYDRAAGRYRENLVLYGVPTRPGG
jgi:hypothetical protein